MATLQLLRPNFNTTDFNRKPLFAYFIPVTMVLVSIGILMFVHAEFKVRIPPVVMIATGLIVGVITRQLIRMMLPDYVNRRDVTGSIEFNDNGIVVTNKKEKSRHQYEKGKFNVVDFKHNLSRESHLNSKKEDEHNGLAELSLDVSGEKRVHKFIIETDHELQAIQKTLSLSA